MIKIEAIVREDKFEDVKQALQNIKINGITVYQVMGCGTQRGYVEYVRGHEVDINMLPKIKFEIVVSDEEWEEKNYICNTKRLLIQDTLAMVRFSLMI